MNKKSLFKWGALFLILLFPFVLYLMLSTGKHNLFDLPYFAPQQQVAETFEFPLEFDDRDEIKVLAYFKDEEVEYNSRVLLQLQHLSAKLNIPELTYNLFFEGKKPDDKELQALLGAKYVRSFEFRTKSFASMNFDLEEGSLSAGEWVLLIDKQNKVRGVYSGQEYSKMKELGEDIKALKAQEFVPKKKR